jgi:hypothetical protein
MIGYITAGLVLQGKHKFSRLDVNAVLTDFLYRTEEDRFAGNGGLSLRRISSVRKILAFQSRYNDTEPEDEWFGKRITVLPGAKVATGAQENHFSVEAVWHEKPMGYHVKDGGEDLAEDVWKDPEKRRKNFEYCPELAMIMPMKLERERCDGDNREGEIVDEEAKAKEEEEANRKAAEAEGAGAEGIGAEGAGAEGTGAEGTGTEGAEAEGAEGAEGAGAGAEGAGAGAEGAEADAAKDMPSR